MWHQDRGFTLIEILIVTSLVLILTVSVVSTINPLEQWRKSQDNQALAFSAQLFSAMDRYYAANNTPPFTASIATSPLSSPQAQVMLSNLVNTSELKSFTIGSPLLSSIFVTTSYEPLAYDFCFKPLSRHYRQNQRLCHFNQSGQSFPLPNDCYICQIGINTSTPTSIATLIPPQPTTPLSPTTTPTPIDTCQLNPEYPFYPSTSFYMSDKFSNFSCDRYQVNDLGCLSNSWRWVGTPCSEICSQGQRCLKKSYSRPINFYDPKYLNCLAHSTQAVEYYCSTEPYANCVNHPTASDDYDFDFGCSNPRRSINWKTQ